MMLAHSRLTARERTGHLLRAHRAGSPRARTVADHCVNRSGTGGKSALGCEGCRAGPVVHSPSAGCTAPRIDREGLFVRRLLGTAVVVALTATVLVTGVAGPAGAASAISSPTGN